MIIGRTTISSSTVVVDGNVARESTLVMNGRAFTASVRFAWATWCVPDETNGIVLVMRTVTVEYELNCDSKSKSVWKC